MNLRRNGRVAALQRALSMGQTRLVEVALDTGKTVTVSASDRAASAVRTRAHARLCIDVKCRYGQL